METNKNVMYLTEVQIIGPFKSQSAGEKKKSKHRKGKI